jgi:hypothetical protein
MKRRSLLGASLVASLAGVVSAQTITGGYSSSNGLSHRVSELPRAVATGTLVRTHPQGPSNNPHQPDGAVQTNMGPLINATGGVSFTGMSVFDGGYIPSDNNIAVGPNHVVEVVNAAYAVYSKTGATLLTPRSLGALWPSGPCSNKSGDTVVQYDRLANRWIITQLGSLSSPYSECIAVSTGPDPTTTTYSLYSYDFGTNLNDYPKFGVWPTTTNGAYLATYNLFASGASFVGAEICAYDRTAMLAGAASAGFVCATGISGASFLPIDLDGPTPPPDGTPGYFMDLFGSSLGVYKFSPNFSATPPTATLSSFSTIPVAGYSSASSSPQPSTTETLDSLSDRAMFRLAYRRFSTHDSVVVNHSVVGGAGGNSGVRWYELQASTPGGPFSLFQQGTYAPDSSYRWMGSAAMDQAGDIAIGYSVSDATTTFPSVRYTGRTPADTLGTMETEGVIINGSGSQTGYTRWGDYSSMRIDPSDDCTFWYVNEYYPATASASWYTRIGSFKFSNCSSNPDFGLSASPSTQTVAPGNNATSTVSVAPLNGWSGSVTLSIMSGCPGTGTCSLSLTTVPANGTSTLTVNTATPGVYTVTVKGTDTTNSSLTHTTTFTVTVATPDFSISASPPSLSITQGNAGGSTITVTSLGGFSSPVDLTVSGCPSGTTCLFSLTPVTPTGTSTLTVTTSGTTPLGTVTLTITGKGPGGTPTHSTMVSLTVNPPPPDFTISAPPSPLTVNRGSSSSYTVTVKALTGSSTVKLSVSGLPSRTTASFNPTSVGVSSITPSATSTLTITDNRKGNSSATVTLTITGTSGGVSHSTTVTLIAK